MLLNQSLTMLILSMVRHCFEPRCTGAVPLGNSFFMWWSASYLEVLEFSLLLHMGHSLGHMYNMGNFQGRGFFFFFEDGF